MVKSEIVLGCVAKDTISGFTGVVVCISEWLNGCKRITIQPQELREGKRIDNDTFDVEQVELIEPCKFAKGRPTGGPSIAPVRPADPSR